MHVGKQLAAMLAANKRLAGVTPEVNLREHNTYTTTKSNKAAHFGFETQRRHHHKSKTGYQWDHKRTYVLQIIFKKKSESLALPAPYTIQDVETVDHYSHT